MNTIRAVLALAAALTTSSAFAANIEFNGYYEGYYLYNTATPGSATGDAQNTLRLNDRNHNQITTNMIELGAKGAVSKSVGFTAEVGYGDLNEAIHGNNSNTAGDDENRDLLNQGYLTLMRNGWTVDLGRFYSHMGFETVKAKDNWNFSRSFTYSAVLPKWHEGVRTNFIDTATFGVSGYLYNGSDIANDNNDGKSLGARVRWSPSRDFVLMYNVINGPEQLNTESNNRLINNVTAKWTLSDRIALGGELTLAKEEDLDTVNGEDGDWLGLAAYARFGIARDGYIAGRFEHATDDEGVILNGGTTAGTDLKVTSLTATLGWDQGEGLATWAELRHDRGNKKFFREDVVDTTKTQTTALVGLTYAL